MINALEFLKGDGITNDAPRLQALLDAVGLEVYLPGGRDYYFGGGLVINEPVTLRMGYGARLIRNFVSLPLFTVGTVYGSVVLEGIIDAGPHPGTFLELGEGQSVYDLVVRDCESYNGGITIRGTINNRLAIQDNHVGDGTSTRIIAVVPSEVDYVQNMVVSGNRLIGDGVAGSSKNGHVTTGRNIRKGLIECNVSENSGGDGFDLDGGLRNAVVRHNHVLDAQRCGYEVKPGSGEGTANITLSGNYATRCGLESGNAAYSLKTSGIYIGNTALDCHRGVYVSGSEPMALGGFYASGCERGIWVQGAPRGVILQGCVVDEADIGIAILAGGDWRNVSDCRLTNCVTGVSWSNTLAYPLQRGVVKGCYIEAQYPITKMDNVEIEKFANHLIVMEPA